MSSGNRCGGAKWRIQGLKLYRNWHPVGPKKAFGRGNLKESERAALRERGIGLRRGGIAFGATKTPTIRAPRRQRPGPPCGRRMRASIIGKSKFGWKAIG